MAKTTKRETQIKIAREILQRHEQEQYSNLNGYIIFAELRTAWEKRCIGDFDNLIRELIFTEDAWLKDGYRGQQRHGRGFDGHPEKQIVKLYIF